jgi:hypothetical protein
MDGIICTPQDLERSNLHCLTRDETISLTVRVSLPQLLPPTLEVLKHIGFDSC